MVQSVCVTVTPQAPLCHLCRRERILSDIVADEGRPVRLRYCSTSEAPAREEELPAQLDINKAVAIIKAVHAAQHTGAHPAFCWSASASLRMM